jgi:hypothetical protein
VLSRPSNISYVEVFGVQIVLGMRSSCKRFDEKGERRTPLALGSESIYINIPDRRTHWGVIDALFGLGTRSRNAT